MLFWIRDRIKKKTCIKRMAYIWKNKVNPAQYGNNTDTPMVQSHLSVCLCIWAALGVGGGGADPASLFFYCWRYAVLPVLPVFQGISSQYLDSDVSHWTAWIHRKLVGKKFVPSQPLVQNFLLAQCLPSLTFFPTQSVAVEVLVFITAAPKS